jgi:hypothetical protein
MISILKERNITRETIWYHFQHLQWKKTEKNERKIQHFILRMCSTVQN